MPLFKGGDGFLVPGLGFRVPGFCGVVSAAAPSFGFRTACGVVIEFLVFAHIFKRFHQQISKSNITFPGQRKAFKGIRLSLDV